MDNKVTEETNAAAAEEVPSEQPQYQPAVEESQTADAAVPLAPKEVPSEQQQQQQQQPQIPVVEKAKPAESAALLAPTQSEVVTTMAPPASSGSGHNVPLIVLMLVIAACAIIGVVELGALVGMQRSAEAPASPTFIIGGAAGIEAGAAESIATGAEIVPDTVQAPPEGENICAGSNPNFPNRQCIDEAMGDVGPQSGSNITKGYVGGMDVGDLMPITTSYFKAGLCPVNVHWHLGTEHYSLGEFDEEGKGPRDINTATDGGTPTLGSFQCHHYDKDDPKFTRVYDWKHCIGMEVGQTYEVHWPHSAAGACGTPNQFQTPFYDGVFCNLDLDTFLTLKPQDIAKSVGVQGQVFTIVNDETYFRPNLMRGMIVDGDFGKDVAIYTGSSTGSARSNSICSAYSPVTWQVDRKCHLISASSFDLMCAEMKMQRDDMTYDLTWHGSRPLVDKEFVADNQQTRGLRGKEETPKLWY